MRIALSLVLLLSPAVAAAQDQGAGKKPFSVSFFSKTTDEITASSEYRYRQAFIPWVGPMALAQQLRLFDVGTRESVFGRHVPVVFTGWFEPQVLSETAGFFFEPPGIAPR